MKCIKPTKEFKKCIACGKEMECEWWHDVVYHNMPLDWYGHNKEEILEHIKYHLSYLMDSIEIKLKK